MSSVAKEEYDEQSEEEVVEEKEEELKGKDKQQRPKENDFVSRNIVLDELTSDHYGKDNPPRDWADASLLIPHEAIRREMNAMVLSAEALNSENKDNEKSESWRVVYFAEWYVNSFCPLVHHHHTVEEDVFFPWVAKKATLPKKLTSDHKTLMTMMDNISEVCKSIIHKNGMDCLDEIRQLKETIPLLNKDMREHLKEEEASIGPILREYFTEEETGEFEKKLMKEAELSLMRGFLPSIFAAMKKWTTPEYFKGFESKIPPPIRHLIYKYYVPDYLNDTCPRRDAPILSDKPTLTTVGCCGLSFCFKCIL